MTRGCSRWAWNIQNPAASTNLPFKGTESVYKSREGRLVKAACTVLSPFYR